MSKPLHLRLALLVGAILTAGCSETPTTAPSMMTPAAAVANLPHALPQFNDWIRSRLAGTAGTAPSDWPMLVGAGDIAECYEAPVPPSLEQARAQALASPAAATADLLDAIPGKVIALGDNAYEVGSPFD